MNSTGCAHDELCHTRTNRATFSFSPRTLASPHAPNATLLLEVLVQAANLVGHLLGDALLSLLAQLLLLGQVETDRKALLVDQLGQLGLAVLARLLLDVEIERQAALDELELLGLALVENLREGGGEEEEEGSIQIDGCGAWGNAGKGEKHTGTHRLSFVQETKREDKSP